MRRSRAGLPSPALPENLGGSDVNFCFDAALTGQMSLRSISVMQLSSDGEAAPGAIHFRTGRAPGETDGHSRCQTAGGRDRNPCEAAASASSDNYPTQSSTPKPSRGLTSSGMSMTSRHRLEKGVGRTSACAAVLSGNCWPGAPIRLRTGVPPARCLLPNSDMSGSRNVRLSSTRTRRGSRTATSAACNGRRPQDYLS